MGRKWRNLVTAVLGTSVTAPIQSTAVERLKTVYVVVCNLRLFDTLERNLSPMVVSWRRLSTRSPPARQRKIPEAGNFLNRPATKLNKASVRLRQTWMALRNRFQPAVLC
jgi:hypothetical protein